MITYEEIRELLPGARSYTGYVAGLCPFHDDHKPSLLIFEDGWFQCLGCGVIGNYDKLYRKLKGYDVSKVAVAGESFRAPRLPTDLLEQEDLCEEAHLTLQKYEQLRWYLENRGVEGRIDSCGLGWYKGWYTIPIRSHYGQYQGMVIRAGSAIQKVSGLRFAQPKGQKPMMYCPDWILYEKADTLAIVFGMFDALAISDLRFAVVTPIMGKDSFNPEWLSGWRKRVVVIPDKGEESTAVSLAGKFGWRGSVLNLVYPDEIKDPCGFMETGRRDQLLSQVGGILS